MEHIRIYYCISIIGFCGIAWMRGGERNKNKKKLLECFINTMMELKKKKKKTDIDVWV